MSKISYNFQVPKEKYDLFKEDIKSLASRYELSDEIIFDDTKQSCKFLFSADIIEKFFSTKIENGEEKYPFFCCNPTNYQNCLRQENKDLISFQQARKNELKFYERLKLKRDRQLVLSQNILQKDDFDFENDLIIGEYHPDPLPKEFLIGFMESCKMPNKPIIAVERLPAALNGHLEKWLKDGDKESALPLAIQEYCQLVDGQNNGEKLEFAENRDRSVTKLLYSAKENKFDVVFFESEQSTISCQGQANRHECLVTSLCKVRQEYPNRNFLVLAGAYHDNAAFEKVTMSKALSAKSCAFFSVELADVFLKHQEECLARGSVENAKIYGAMANQILGEKTFAKQVLSRSAAAGETSITI